MVDNFKFKARYQASESIYYLWLFWADKTKIFPNRNNEAPISLVAIVPNLSKIAPTGTPTSANTTQAYVYAVVKSVSWLEQLSFVGSYRFLHSFCVNIFSWQKNEILGTKPKVATSKVVGEIVDETFSDDETVAVISKDVSFCAGVTSLQKIFSSIKIFCKFGHPNITPQHK